MVKCQHCGKQIPYDANLCPYCGRSIKQLQQKDPLEADPETVADEPVEQTEIIDRPPKPANDRKLLFFIIAVLALLLIVGAIYHYSSVTTEEETVHSKDSVDTRVVDSLLDVKSVSKVAFNPKKSQQVVVNGEGVRMRFGPSLKAEYLKDEKGATRSVKKGTRLECVGESGDWYQVVYMGKRYYMSKQYTYLEE